MGSINAFKGKKILIADDNEMNRMILSDMLENEFELVEAADGREAIDILQKDHENIALVLLDIVMPGMDGYDVLEEMNARNWIDDTQVIVISAENTPLYMKKAFDLGAIDYISRPFDQAVVHRRILNSIMLCSKQDELQQLVKEQILAREKNSSMMVSILSHIVEFKNGESGKHVLHINMLTEMLLRQLLTKTNQYDAIADDISIIRMASSLHDIGKIVIPDEILNKPGKLTDQEFEIMKSHTTAGARMIQQIKNYENEPLVRYAYQICRWHHEKWDGKGYPDRLVGDDIPIAAQVVSLADVYDALTSERCYKKAYSHDEAIRMIKNNECGVFNPQLISCLDDLDERLRTEIAEDYPQGEETARRIARDTLSQINSHYRDTAERAAEQPPFAGNVQDILFRYSTEPWVEYNLNCHSTVPGAGICLRLNDAAKEYLGTPDGLYYDKEIDQFLYELLGEQDARMLWNSVMKTTSAMPKVNTLATLNRPDGKKEKIRVIGEGQWGQNDAGESQLNTVLLKILPQEE